MAGELMDTELYNLLHPNPWDVSDEEDADDCAGDYEGWD